MSNVVFKRRNHIAEQYQKCQFNSNGFCSGVIADLGLDSEVSERIGGTETVVDVIDASGKCIVPGLVDGHVHPVWAGKELIHLYKTPSPIIFIT